MGRKFRYLNEDILKKTKTVTSNYSRGNINETNYCRAGK
jgi:hypothetical protein